MATNKMLFGSSNVSITCTITSLANNGQRGSAYVDNSSNLYLDALVMVKAKTASSSTSSTGTINVYAYGSVDGATTFSDGVGGTDAGVTLTAPPNTFLIGVINCVANSTTYYGGPFSVAQAFGGDLPQYWGVIIENKTGATLDGSVGSVYFQAVQTQYV